jgi:5-methylcytosine-specific restriction protein B
MDPGPTDELVYLTCAQVPADFDVGSDIWLWLGSDNNKGQATDWDQGVRAYGHCESKSQEGKSFTIGIKISYVLPRSVQKVEFLQTSPATYADALFETPIVGLNNYSMQVVQTLTDQQFLTLSAAIARLLPDVSDDIFEMIEDAATVEIIEPDSPEPPHEPEHEQLTSELPDSDPVLEDVLNCIEGDNAGGVLLTGAPGTGKSWYARQIAIKLTGGDASRIRRVQFHPSYQYEDFVEGYVPRGGGGFSLEKKHLLLAADKARRTEGWVVLVIDEFSRTDPSRVLGECLTYMEGSLRDQDFLLSSGRTARIPRNLVFLATMNPEDRSVDEIDAAMDRRWSKIELHPDPSKVAQFLRTNKAPDAMIVPVVDFFTGLQKHTPVGHAFFRMVRDLPSLSRLWQSQLRHIVAKHYRYDKQARAAVDAEWAACITAVSASVAGGAAEPTTSAAETPVPNNA